jgi:hypothetical protein
MELDDCEDALGFLVRHLNVEDAFELADDLNAVQVVIQPKRIWHNASPKRMDISPQHLNTLSGRLNDAECSIAERGLGARFDGSTMDGKIKAPPSAWRMWLF